MAFWSCCSVRSTLNVARCTSVPATATQGCYSQPPLLSFLPSATCTRLQGRSDTDLACIAFARAPPPCEAHIAARRASLKYPDMLLLLHQAVCCVGVAYDVSLPCPNEAIETQRPDSQAPHRRLRTARKLVMAMACSPFSSPFTPAKVRQMGNSRQESREDTRIKVSKIHDTASRRQAGVVSHKPEPVNGNTPYLQGRLLSVPVGKERAFQRARIGHHRCPIQAGMGRDPAGGRTATCAVGQRRW